MVKESCACPSALCVHVRPERRVNKGKERRRGKSELVPSPDVTEVFKTKPTSLRGPGFSSSFNDEGDLRLDTVLKPYIYFWIQCIYYLGSVMSWLLTWVLLVARLHLAVSLNSSVAPFVSEFTTLEPYNQTRYCQWPCTCSEIPPSCPPGVSLIMDGCDCCKACAKQVGEECNEADNCDHHRGLYCDYSSDKPRYEKGVCAYLLGIGCEHNGVIYRNGQSFQPNCKYQCLCVNGAIGCIPLCNESQPPRVWCPVPRRVKIPGHCCEQWICEEPRRGRKAAPRHTMAALFSGKDTWQENCVTQTSPWSLCSKTCGRGVSLRITNANKQCRMVKERRLCSIRPCEVDITKHIKPGKKCRNIYREDQPIKFTISGCTSKKLYWPKYCGVCTDERCCIPYKSKTVQMEFQCSNGDTVTWQVMWINACFCNLSCKNPNDIFTDLEQYYENQEIMT